MNSINKNFTSIGQIAGEYLGNKQAGKEGGVTDSNLSFQNILQQKQQKNQIYENSELKFSKHASTRLSDRNIYLSHNQMKRLESGTVKAGEKGINESLVIVDELAFIVNIPNKTVITAIDQSESSDNVYTNIDGAVIT